MARNPALGAARSIVTWTLGSALCVLSVDAGAQRAARPTPAGGRVHETLSRAVSNGCDWRAELDGTVEPGRTGAADVRVSAEVRCPNGQTAHTASRRVRVASSSPVDLARALERAASVTAVDGADRCAYAPTLRVDGARVESMAVGVACLTSDEDAVGRGGGP